MKEYEVYCLGIVGITPDKFWMSTLRELALVCGAYENAEMRYWERTRNIEFSMYNTQYGAMSGKKLFKTIRKPADLYPLRSDVNNKPIVVDKSRQLIAVNRFKRHLAKTK